MDERNKALERGRGGLKKVARLRDGEVLGGNDCPAMGPCLLGAVRLGLRVELEGQIGDLWIPEDTAEPTHLKKSRWGHGQGPSSLATTTWQQQRAYKRRSPPRPGLTGTCGPCHMQGVRALVLLAKGRCSGGSKSQRRTSSAGLPPTSVSLPQGQVRGHSVF